MSYYDIYTRRVNRFGTNFQGRIQSEREYGFEQYLLKSVYRVKFQFDNKEYVGSFEPYKQDETETLHYLLTKTKLILPSGTIIDLPNSQHILQKWMVFWLEDTNASGYNRYLMIRMTHQISINDTIYYGYLEGPGKKAVRDSLKSSKGDVVFNQNENLYLFITEFIDSLKKDNYLEISMNYNNSTISKGFTITELDILSTPGISYISLDPTYISDKTPKPVRPAGDTSDDYYWLEGGI